MDGHKDFPAQLINVVDGDTMDFRVDLGFRTYKKIRVRVLDIDTAEIFGVKKDSDEYQTGIEQKKFAQNFLDEEGEWPIVIRTFEEEKGKYGRWLAHIFVDGDRYSEVLTEKWPEAKTS